MLHVIQKQVIDFRLRNSRADSRVLDEVSSLCHQVVNPVIEKLLDRYGRGSDYLLVERLELDLGSMRQDELHHRLEERVEHTLVTRLEQLMATPPQPAHDTARAAISGADAVAAEQLSSEEAEWQLLRSYLGSGALPWWAARHSLSEIRALIQRSIEERPAQLRQLLQQLPVNNVTRRLAMQFDSTLNWTIISLLLGQSAAWGRLLARMVDVLKEKGRRQSGEKSAQAVIESLLREALVSPDGVYEQIVWVYAGGQAASDSEGGRVIKQLHEAFVAMVTPPSEAAIHGALLEKHIIPVDDHLAGSKVSQRDAPHALKADSGDTGDSTAERLTGEQREALPPKPVPEAGETLPDDGVQVVGQHAVNALADDSESPAEAIEARAEVEQNNVGSVHIQHAPPVDKVNDALQSGHTVTTDLEASGGNVLVSAEALYIHNAGLILLWQYLPHYFQALGLMHDGRFIDDAAQARAVLTLQYLTAFESEFSEPDMSLSKLLCGLDVTEPVPLHFAVEERERDEAEALLHSLITHWSVLGSTTVAGLQESFLRRDSRLQRSDIGWQMVVERRAYDMLLDKLPWGIGLVRLKWMQQAVSVEW